MIVEAGATRGWSNVHVTHRADVANLVYADNSSPPGSPQLDGFDLLKKTALDVGSVVEEAASRGKTVRALGSAWALTDIAVTDGYLINTKALNASYDVADKHFHDAYPEAKRPFVVVTQCGATIADLNVFLETSRFGGLPRSLKTAGVGAGQTVVGSFSGNTHGAAIKFGSSPDYVVGLQVVTGDGRSLWLERESSPVLSDAFAARIGATPLRDDDVFESALVSFGAFGVIVAVALEVDPIYHLKFDPVREVPRAEIERRVAELTTGDDSDPAYPYHYEFIFNPYDHGRMLEASALRVPYTSAVPTPTPVWIVRNRSGFALGDRVPIGFLDFRLVPARLKAKVQLDLYRNRAILDDVQGTPGQLFTATITYFEGYAESAIAVSTRDVPAMIEVSSAIIKSMRLPAISQVRLVHPTRATLGFTGLEPKTAVFEWGLVNDERFARFEARLSDELERRGIAFRYHWSKNSGLTPALLGTMFGAGRVDRWKAARRTVFEDRADRMRVFDNEHLRRCGLA